MNLKIGILALGMVILFIASTIPAVAIGNGDPWIEIRDGDEDEDQCARIVFHNFDDGTAYTINIQGKYEGLISNSNGNTVVTICPGEGNVQHIELAAGVYHVTVKCDQKSDRIMEQDFITVV